MIKSKFIAINKYFILIVLLGLLSPTLLANNKIIRLNFLRKIVLKTDIDYTTFSEINPLIKKISFWAADYSDSTLSFSLGLLIASDNKDILGVSKDKLIIGAYKDMSLYIDCNFSCNFIERKNFIKYDESYFEILKINTKEKYIEIRKSTYKKFNNYKDAVLFEYISKIPAGVLIKGLDSSFTSLQKYLDTTKYTLIQFWAYWCPPCASAVKLANDLFEQKNRSLNIIGINCDTRSSKNDILKYIEEKKIMWNVGLDDKIFSQKLLHLFGSAPLSILFDKKGNLIKLYPTLNDISIIVN